MKKYIVTAVLLFMMVFPAFVVRSDDTEGHTAALVNGVPISTEALERKVGEAFAKLMSDGNTADPERLKKDVLETLINNELLYQESVRGGYEPSELKVEMQFSNIRGQFGTEGEFLEMLSQRGYTADSLREELERVMAIDDYIGGEVATGLDVAQTEVRRYYDDNPNFFHEPEAIKASHILIMIEDAADEQQKKTAYRTISDIKKKIDKGEPFESLAKEHSDCPSSAQGGDLGYFQKGQMVKPFEDAAFALKVGEVSDIVETRFGYHLIKLVDRKPERTMPFDEVKGDIEQYLGEQKVYAELKKIVERLRSEAKIERYL
jgi:peptidyl-prolyl cis-trans isomerase C